jgi:thymidine kinase
MAKLYFRYGVVGSAKTLNLLAVAHNYRQQGKNVLLIKPAVDTRFGTRTIGTRAGLNATADIVVPETGAFDLPQLVNTSCQLRQ